MNSLLPKSGRIFILLQRENLLSSRWNCPYRFLLFVSELYYSAESSFLWDLKLIIPIPISIGIRYEANT